MLSPAASSRALLIRVPELRRAIALSACLAASAAALAAAFAPLLVAKDRVNIVSINIWPYAFSGRYGHWWSCQRWHSGLLQTTHFSIWLAGRGIARPVNIAISTMVAPLVAHSSCRAEPALAESLDITGQRGDDFSSRMRHSFQSFGCVRAVIRQRVASMTRRRGWRWHLAFPALDWTGTHRLGTSRARQSR